MILFCLQGLQAPPLIPPSDFFRFTGVIEDIGTCEGDTSPALCKDLNSDVGDGFVVQVENDRIFTGGGSKDFEDISPAGVTGDSVWLHKPAGSSAVDKNNITNAYAGAIQAENDVCITLEVDFPTGGEIVGEIISCALAVASTPTPDGMGGFDEFEFVHMIGDLILYFGSDRFANNGDAFAGFWFFQEQIGLTPDKLKGGEKFSGVHRDRDVLVLTNFPQASNKMPFIEVFAWDEGEKGDPSDVAPGKTLFEDNLVKLFETNITCEHAPGGLKQVCAQTNSTEQDSPWAYVPKSGASGTFPFESFIEGGINISKLLGPSAVCFSSFMAETRASESVTATLKDFALGSFQLCNAGAVTEIHDSLHAEIVQSTSVHATSPVKGDTVHDEVTITGENFAGAAPDPTSLALVTFVLYPNIDCTATGVDESNPFGTNAVDISTGSLVIGSNTTDGISTAESVPFQLTATGDHSYKSFWPGNTDYPGGAVSACEPFVVIQPEIKISKIVDSCGTDLTKFDVFIDSVKKGNIGDGENTGFIGVGPNTYTISETVSPNYISSVGGKDCSIGTTSGSVTVAGNDMKECQFINTRKPKVTVVKELQTGTGTFDLIIEKAADDTLIKSKTNVGDGGTVMSLISDHIGSGFFTGPTIREIGHDPTPGNPASGDETDLTAFTTIIECEDLTTVTFNPGFTGARERTLNNLAAGEHITCTIINRGPATAGACLTPTPTP